MKHFEEIRIRLDEVGNHWILEFLQSKGSYGTIVHMQEQDLINLKDVLDDYFKEEN